MLMHKPQYTNIVQKATEFLNSSSPGSEKNEVSDKLNDIRMRWEELNRKTNERQTQLEDMLPLAQKYHEHAQNVKDVLTLAETELGTCTDVSPDVEIAKQELQNIKVSKPYQADFVVLRAVLCWFTQLVILRCLDTVFHRPYRCYSIALIVILSLSDRYEIFTTD